MTIGSNDYVFWYRQFTNHVPDYLVSRFKDERIEAMFKVSADSEKGIYQPFVQEVLCSQLPKNFHAPASSSGIAPHCGIETSGRGLQNFYVAEHLFNFLMFPAEGASDQVPMYMRKMLTVSDFLVIITGCIFKRTGGVYFRHGALSTTDACALSTVIIYASRDGSVWLTVAFTIDRFVAICCQSLKTSYCSQETASLFIGDNK
eukprot:g37021.t1